MSLTKWGLNLLSTDLPQTLEDWVAAFHRIHEAMQIKKPTYTSSWLIRTFWTVELRCLGVKGLTVHARDKASLLQSAFPDQSGWIQRVSSEKELVRQLVKRLNFGHMPLELLSCYWCSFSGPEASKWSLEDLQVHQRELQEKYRELSSPGFPAHPLQVLTVVRASRP